MATTIAQWALAGTAALLPILVVFLCRVAREYVGRIRDERLRELILRLVEAAEQIYGPAKGSEKLRYVVGGLKECGYSDVHRDAIEAAVLGANEKAARIACCKAGAAGAHLGQAGG